jgi:hypothetical protein
MLSAEIKHTRLGVIMLYAVMKIVVAREVLLKWKDQYG